MNKKHLHICHALPLGGITTFVKALVNLNADSNVKHHILVWQKGENDEFVTDISGCKHQNKAFNQIVQDYDLLFVHALKLSFLPTLLRRKNTVYLFQHGMTFGSGFRRLYKKAVYFSAVNIFRFNVICSSGFAKEKLKSQIVVFKDSLLKIVPFGVELEHNTQISETKHQMRIGFAGRLVAQKRIDVLFESLSKLNPHTQVALHIAGTGVLLNELKMKAKHIENEDIEINFLGQLDEMSNLYTNIDIFVLPSVGESYGLVVLEALFHNIPVIVFEDTGACVDFIENGKNGYIVKNNVELTEKLYELKSIELRQQLKRTIQSMDFSKFHISNTKAILDEL